MASHIRELFASMRRKGKKGGPASPSGSQSLPRLRKARPSLSTVLEGPMRRMSDGSSRRMDVPDLTVIYASDGEDWQRYLEDCFRQLIPPTGNGDKLLHIHREAVEHLSFPLSPARVAHVRRSKAQLVILTPAFLDFVQARPGTNIGQLFEPTRVVAMLCGVERSDVESIHRAELVTFPSWHLMPVVDQDKEFVLQLFRKTVELMEVAEETLAGLTPQFKLTPRKVREGSNKVFVLLNEPVSATDQDVRVYITNSRGLREEATQTKIRNLFTIQFTIPVTMLRMSQMLSIQVTCDGVSLGVRQLKCESQMGELNQLLQSVNDPLAFLCQTLGLTGTRTKELDKLLVQNFKKNLAPGEFHLLDCSSEIYARKSTESMPTLLHFAAHYGFQELCSCLLDCHAAKTASNIRNSSGQTPANMAEAAGHSDLAQLLDDFANLSVTADLYIYASRVNECADDNSKCYENVYDIPRSNAPWYASPWRAPVPVTPAGTTDYDVDGNDRSETYLPMSCGSTSSLASYLEPHQRLILGLEDNQELTPTAKDDTNTDNERSSVQQRPADRTGYTPSQIELLEILEDFKQNKFSMNEVEQLFEDWKARQNTQSFEEKQKQLAALRTKYEEIQHNATEKGKKSLSFDRIMSAFTPKKNKKPIQTKNKLNMLSTKKDPIFYEELNNRPISTLSTASSSSSTSSDRLSTISNTSSTCDSGAQSDSGEDYMNFQRERLGSIGDKKPTPPRKPSLRRRTSLALKEKIAQLEITFSLPTAPAPVPKDYVRPLPSIPAGANLPTDQGKKASSIEDRKPMPPPRPVRKLPPTPTQDSDAINEKHNASPDYVIPDPIYCFKEMAEASTTFKDELKSKLGNSQAKVPPSSRYGRRSTEPNLHAADQQDPIYVNMISSEVRLAIEDHHPIVDDETDYYNVPPRFVLPTEASINNVAGSGKHLSVKSLDLVNRRKLSLSITPNYENCPLLPSADDVPTENPPPPPPQHNKMPRFPPRSPMTGKKKFT